MHGACPDEPSAPGIPSDAVLAVLRRGHAAGRDRHGDLGLPFEDFARDAVGLVASRRAALGLAPGAGDGTEVFAALALEDLYLARACERGDERAWRVLRDVYLGRLRGLAIARGLRGSDAESVAADVFSELALPAPRGTARTLLGTFAGSGSLWAWLAASLVRRVARATPRTRAPAAGDPEEPGVSAPPWRDSLERETGRRLGAALREAWSSLETSERLCLAWKHRDGLEQRRIAALLAVGEHQVSRWISRAVAKVRGAVERCDVLESGESASPSLWSRLEHVVAQHLASVDTPKPPPSDPSSAQGPSP